MDSAPACFPLSILAAIWLSVSKPSTTLQLTATIAATFCKYPLLKSQSSPVHRVSVYRPLLALQVTSFPIREAAMRLLDINLVLNSHSHIHHTWVSVIPLFVRTTAALVMVHYNADE